MIDKKKITSSIHRPDFKIYQIVKLEGIKKTDNKRQSDRFSSPIFGNKVPDKIVVPEIQDILGNPGKRLDAFRDQPQVKTKDDYSEFNIINNETRIQVLGGKKYEEVEEKPNVQEPIEPKNILEQIKFNNDDNLNIEEEKVVVEKKSIYLEPLQKEEEEPKPGIVKSTNFLSKAGFEDFDGEEEHNIKPKVEVKKTVVNNQSKQKYIKPDPKIFKIRETDTEKEPQWLLEQIDIINNTLKAFNVDAYVIGKTKGPTVTRYELSLSPGINVNRINSISDNLQMNLKATSIRIEAPIPGKPYVGLEVPNVNPEIVAFGNVVNTKEFLSAKEPLKVALGVDIDGQNVYVDIAKMPHGLIAGATNSGKSVSVNTLLASLLIKNTPDELKLILIDPKMVELTAYNDLPHLITPVITEPKMASQALKWVVEEMENRYRRFAKNRSRDIKSFNENVALKRIDEEKMPYIVIIIDELADLMNVAASDVEVSVQRITQKARAAGIHLMVATQRPTTDVVKGTIKSNIPSRIAFRVSSYVDSITIIDGAGAEKLLGKGDMLLKETDRLIRLQGAYIPDDEIYALTDYIRTQGEPNYLLRHEDLNRQINDRTAEIDEMFHEIAYFVVTENVASINRITNEFSIGFNRAQSIVKTLEDFGIVSGQEGTKPREVLVSLTELESILNS